MSAAENKNQKPSLARVEMSSVKRLRGVFWARVSGAGGALMAASILGDDSSSFRSDDVAFCEEPFILRESKEAFVLREGEDVLAEVCAIGELLFAGARTVEEPTTVSVGTVLYSTE